MKRLIIAAVILFSASLAIQAQPGPSGMMGPNGQCFSAPMMKMLKLTDEQKDQIAELRLGIQKEIIDLRSQIQKNRVEIKQLMLNDTPDQNAVTNLINQNTKLQGKMKTLRINNWFKVYNLLDDSQKEIFKTSFGRMNRGAKGMGMHRFGKGPRGGFNGNWGPCMQLN